MKVQFFALAALLSVSAFAGPTDMPSESSTHNEDLSVTIKSPHFLRGNKSLFLSYNNTPVTICKALGFNLYLEGDLKYSSPSIGLAMLNLEGNYANTNVYNSYQVDQITCYNELNPQMTVSEKIENPDSTFTITNPKMIRGSKSYPISYNSNPTGVCRALGMDKVLDGSVFTGEAAIGLIIINSEGKFGNINAYNSYALKELTCAKGDSAPVLVDGSGKKYSRKN